MAQDESFEINSTHPFTSVFEADVNRLDVSGLAGLHWAARRGDEAEVTVLIKKGALVDRTDEDGLLPLHWALSGGHDHIARVLLENGSPLDTADVSGLLSRSEFVGERTQRMCELLSASAHSRDKQLDLSFYYFDPMKVPDTMGAMIAVMELDISYNNLPLFPAEFLKLPNLEKLYASDNLFMSLPEEFTSLSKLTAVDFSHNYISDIEPFTVLPKLEELLISHNDVENVPNKLGFLDSLVAIDLSHNFIKKLPRSLCELATLRTLNVSHNRINDVYELQFHRMPSLEMLDVSYNDITEMLWINVMTCRSIKEVRFWNNSFSPALERILECFYSQSATLDLSDLALTDIPKEMTVLAPQLTTLVLANNRFKQLPVDVANMVNLTNLDLSYNRLVDLPLFLHKLTALRTLGLEETRHHLQSPPKSVVDRGLKSIMFYWSDLLSGDPCWRMKLMLVGQENVGKSTLLHCLMQHRLKRKSKRGNISTDGIDIANWSFKMQNKQVLTFSAWDFAGQEIYYTTHSFFISSKAIYLLVWDLRYADDHSRVDFWLNSVASRASNAPVILVGTHLDDPMFSDLSIVEKRLEELNENFGRRFSNIKGITAVSATTGTGVDQLTDMLKDIAMEMPNMKEMLPKIYVRLEEVIHAKIKDKAVNPPAIQWEEFLELAEEVQFKDEEQLLRATQFLSDLGSLVFFEDEKTSERLIVLDPQWLTGMFASVITTKHKMVKNGLLFHKHLGQIWRAPLYPESLHRQLIALLQQFEIMFELPAEEGDDTGEKKCYLLPSLLPEERPEIDLLWPRLDATVTQYARIYELEFVPHGLFSRLMIRLLHFTDRPLKYWRNGVLAVKGPTKSLVTINDKVVSAYTRGDGAPELLRVVIEIIDSLVNQWFQVRLESTKIPCPHCIAANVPEEEVFHFSLEDCEETAAAHKSRFMQCKGDVQVRLDRLVPDIAMTDFEGSQLNFSELEVGRQLGKGSFGVIYLGRWNGETVAIKRLKVDEDMALAAFAEFRREVWLMSGLSHPCIVNLKGYSVNPLTMVMECVPGGDMFGFLHNESIEIDWHIRLKLALDIALGMAFLHGISPPLLHRDLKSPNVLIVDHSDGSPVIAKVADFGLSSRMFVDQLQGRPVENPTWCAPEIMQHNPYTEKADVYSYGMMLWEILTRKLPFASYTFQHQVEDDVVRGIRPDIPDDCWPEYATLIEESWNANPAKRPDFHEVVDRLADLIRTEIGEEEFRFPMFPGARMLEHKRKQESAGNVQVSGSLMKHLTESDIPSPIQSMAFVMNQVWCGCKDGSIVICSAESGRLLRSYTQVHGKAVNVVHEVEGRIWSGGDDGWLMIWKVEDLLNEAEATTVLKEGVLQKGGKKKGLFGNWQSRYFRLFKNGELHFCKSQSEIGSSAGIVPLKGASVEASKKSQRFEIRCADKTFLLQAKTDEEVAEWMEEIKRAILTVSGTPAAQLYSVAINETRSNAPVTCMYELGDGRAMVGSAHGALYIVNENANVIRTIKIIAPSSARISKPDMKVAAMAESFNHVLLCISSKIVRLNPETYACIDALSGHEGDVKAVISVNNQIWSGGADGCIIVWDSKSGRVLSKQQQEGAVLSLLQVGQMVWSGSADGSVSQWDIKTFECKQRLQQQRGALTSLELVYDRLVWSGSLDKTICVWK